MVMRKVLLINAGGGDGAEVIYALRNNAALANDILSEAVVCGVVKYIGKPYSGG